MRSAALLIAVLVVSGCGSETAAPESSPEATAPSGAVPATAPGLAAVVLRHVGGEEAADRLRGGLLDMEDQRAVEVDMVLEDGDATLLVSAHDPDYLPGDRGPDECRKQAVRRTRWGTSECRTLADGTVVQLIEMTYGFSDDNRHGSAAMAIADGPRGHVQVMFESYRRSTDIDAATLGEIVGDPAVGWYTTPGANAEGAELDGFVTRDRVD